MDRKIQAMAGINSGFYINFTEPATEHPGWERWTLHVNDDIELPMSEMRSLTFPISPFVLVLGDGDYGEVWEDGSRHTVYITTPGTRATGAPSISGNLAVGQTLTADTSAISDVDGLTNRTFFYQWFRIDRTIAKSGGLTAEAGDGSVLGGRHRSWLSGAWTSGGETIPPIAGRSAQC